MNFDKILGFSDSNKSLGIIDNVAKQEHIIGISINYLAGAFNDIFYGKVKFKSHDTTLEQEFKGSSLVDVFVKIKNFCENLPK